MSAKPSVTAKQINPDAHEALLDLGKALLAQIDDLGAAEEAATFRARAGRADVRLELADLQADANGEVVLLDDSGLRLIEIGADRPVVADGVMTAHTTLSGDDVSGFRYLRFEGGPTLFYQDGLQLAVDAPSA
jgi:hypothetical protein